MQPKVKHTQYIPQSHIVTETLHQKNKRNLISTQCKLNQDFIS